MDDPLILPDEQKPSEEPKENNPYLIPGAIIAAGALIAFSVMYSNGGMQKAGAPKETAGVGGAVSEKVALYDDTDPFLGNPDAPVTIVEFSDFQCPFCGRFFETVEPQIIEKYVKTGKVKFVYRDFAFLGDESVWAAEAAKCAHEQGKFWQYHDYLFNHQQGENGGAFSKANLKLFAQSVGLDTGAFNSCFDSGKYLAEVQKDTADGRALGVSGTPTNFVNTQAVTGALPLEEFERVIEEELAKAQ
ncbi:MAG: DsbA family protein [bacterium]|nr:DsbA family protein [bacterium]